MGLSGFSYPTNLDCWSYARSAGYPNLKSHPNDGALYLRTLWASYPLENDVVIVNGKVESNDIIISDRNSGGPLYYKYITVQNGQTIRMVNILGIASGSYKTSNYFKSCFYRNTALIVNIVNELI